MDDLHKVIAELLEGISRDDWLLWVGHLIENKADEIDQDTLERMKQARADLLAGRVMLRSELAGLLESSAGLDDWVN